MISKEHGVSEAYKHGQLANAAASVGSVIAKGAAFEDSEQHVKKGKYYQGLVRDAAFNTAKKAYMKANPNATEEEAEAAASEMVMGYDGTKEFAAGAATVASFFGLRGVYERLKANPPSHQPNSANAGKINAPNNSNKLTEESLKHSNDPIVQQAARESKGAMQNLEYLQEKGAGNLYREEVAKKLEGMGHKNLANKVLSGSNVTAEEFTKAGVKPSYFGLQEKMMSDIATKKTSIGLDFQSAGSKSFQSQMSAAEAKVASTSEALKSAIHEPFANKVKGTFFKIGLPSLGEALSGQSKLAMTGRGLGLLGIGYEGYQGITKAEERHTKGEKYR
jgi:hypothetical protein